MSGALGDRGKGGFNRVGTGRRGAASGGAGIQPAQKSEMPDTPTPTELWACGQGGFTTDGLQIRFKHLPLIFLGAGC